MRSVPRSSRTRLLSSFVLAAPLLLGCGGVAEDDPTPTAPSPETASSPSDALSSSDGARCRLFYRAYADFAEAVTSRTPGRVDDTDRQLLRGLAARTQELGVPSAAALRDALQAVAGRAEAAAVASSRTGRVDIAPVNNAVDQVQAVCADAPPP